MESTPHADRALPLLPETSLVKPGTAAASMPVSAVSTWSLGPSRHEIHNH